MKEVISHRKDVNCFWDDLTWSCSNLHFSFFFWILQYLICKSCNLWYKSCVQTVGWIVRTNFIITQYIWPTDWQLLKFKFMFLLHNTFVLPANRPALSPPTQPHIVSNQFRPISSQVIDYSLSLPTEPARYGEKVAMKFKGFKTHLSKQLRVRNISNFYREDA